VDDLIQKVAIRGSKESEKVLGKNQDLKMPNSEMSFRTEQLKNDRPNEWASLKTIDNPSVDIRCCGLGFPGKGFTVKNRGPGRGRYGRRFEETGAQGAVKH
jgi:hypothetical protein